MCTTIKLQSDEGYVLSRTMDFEAPLVFNGLHIPRGTVFAKDLYGQDLEARYRALGIVFYNHMPLKDGINEHGLIGCTNYFHLVNNHARDLDQGRVNISSLDYLNYALLNYKSVEELVEDLENIHIAEVDFKGDKVICPNFHHMFTDRTGRCVVIEPKNRKYVCYDNPYDVMTNSPGFDRHVKKLKETIDLTNLDNFKGAKNLPGGYDPVSRFIRAYFFVRRSLKAEGQKEALANSYNIMDTMNIPHGFIWSTADNHHIYTRYISSYDTKNLTMTAKSFSNQRIYRAKFDDFQEDELKSFDFNMDFTMDDFIGD